jgi:hypothetical protein
VLLAMLTQCRRAEEPAPSQPAASAPVAEDSYDSGPAIDEDVLRQLRSVPYASWTADDESLETGLVFIDEARATPGYTLFANRGACSARLVDRVGRVVHGWEGERGGFWGDAELLRDGTLLLVGAESDVAARQPTDRYLRKLAWDSSIVWDAGFPAHHDLEVLADGRILTLSSVDREVESLGRSAKLIDDRIVICSTEGKIEEEYSLHDLFENSRDVFKPKYTQPGPPRGGSKTVDAFHANSAEWISVGELAATNPIYTEGNILVSLRHQDFIGIFDRRSRRFLWAWGPGTLDSQHSARMLPSGNVLVFDNGLGRGFSRLLEIDPRTDEMVWRYQTADPREFHCRSGGACQWLAGGHVLVTDSRNSRLFEITREGDVVWDYLNPAMDPDQRRRSTIKSARRLPPEHVEAILARVAPATQPAK